MTAGITRSTVESDRFGLRVGRAVVDDPESLPGLDPDFDDYDVVIVRCPASAKRMSVALREIPGFEVIAADVLCYWRWEGVLPPVPDVPLPTSVVGPDDSIDDLVRDAFHSYSNHYTANPLFGADQIMDGYCDWAARLIRSPSTTCVVLEDESGDRVGFGIIDWEPEVPDIRLAGMASAAQGRGLYALVIRALLERAQQRGHASVVISTQVDNVNVMRAWTRLGLVPVDATSTFHLVRSNVLDPEPV